MKKIIFLSAIFFLAIAFTQQPKMITIYMAGDSTMAIKQPSAFPETGWGMPFVYFWDSTVQVVNKAKNGRSTKTFINEGLWNSIIENARQGDYIFIQFGHNDEAKEKAERYTKPEEFTANLNRFISEARQKKAVPVLFTPVSRRRFDSTGTAIETHALYSSLTQKVANQTGVLFIDLDKKTRELYQTFGPENSKLLFLQLKPGEHPNYPDGKNDNTHFNELGARLVAQIALDEIRLLIPDLKSRIVVAKKK